MVSPGPPRKGGDARAVKRETGESPVQSPLLCAVFSGCNNITPLALPHHAPRHDAQRRKSREGCCRPTASQKTCLAKI